MVRPLLLLAFLATLLHPSMSQAPPLQGSGSGGQPAAAPGSGGFQDRANITIWGNAEVMVDANITQIQISVEVRSQLLGDADSGQWVSSENPAQFSAQAPGTAAAAQSSVSSSSGSAAADSKSSPGNYPQENWQSADSVQRAVSQRTDALVAYLKAQPHIKLLKTVSMSLRPLERWKDGEMFNYGWVGMHTLSFEVDAEHAGQYIDESIRNGATRIDSVSMKPSDEDNENARDRAVQIAAHKAVAQAGLLLQSLGLSKESMSVLDIQVDPSFGVVPFRTFDMAAMPMASEAQQQSMGGFSKVVGGQQAVSARVQLRLSFQQSQLRPQQL